MRLIYNSDAQRLQKNFDDKTPVTVSELFRTERTASLPIELFLVDDDGGYSTPSSSDYEVIIGRQGQAITTGKLTLTFTGTTEEIDLSKPKLATRIEAALNAVSAVDSAGGVDVIELSPRAYQITFRSNGSRAAMSAAVAQSMQPASALISEVTAGTVSSREVQLLTLEEASLAEVSTSGWSTNSNPTLTISTLVGGTANTREVVQLEVTGDPASGSFFVVSNSEPISTEATAAQVKSILNAALSNDIGSVKKTGERIWQITYKTNGDKTALSAGTHNLVKRPSVNATLNLNTTALAYAANSDGSNLSIGFTLRKGTEILLSEPIDLHEPFAKTLGSSASLSNAITLTPFLELAGGTMSGAIAMGSQKITGLADGVASSDAATKGQLDALIDGSPENLNTLNELAAALNDDQNFSTTVTNSIATKLPLAGGTLSGAIAMGSNKITGLADGVASGDAVNKGQLDALIDGSPENLNTLNELAAAINDDQNFSTTVTNSIATKLPLAGGTLTGALQLKTGSAASPSLAFSSDTNTGIFGGTDVMGFTTGGTEVARFDSSGHFLIPDNNRIKLGDDADLEIYNAANSNSVIKKTNLGGLFILNNSTTYIQGTFGEDMARFIKDGANQFYYDGSLKLSTTSTGASVSGSLLIDSTYPRIFLTDSNHNSDFSIINNDGSFAIYDDTNTAYRFQILADGDIAQNYINYTDASNYEALKISAESDHIKINTESVGSFSSQTRDLRFNINGTEKGKISNAGIFTNNNYYISGTGSLRNFGNDLKLTTGGGDYDIEFIPNNTTRMTLKSDTGRLGIGTTNPQKTVDVTGDIRASTNLFASNNIYAAFKFVFGSSTSEGEYIERHGGSDLAFYGNGGHRFTVKGSGDCKIEDAGKGLILATPDGNNTYRVSIDNSGNLVTTQL